MPLSDLQEHRAQENGLGRHTALEFLRPTLNQSANCLHCFAVQNFPFLHVLAKLSFGGMVFAQVTLEPPKQGAESPQDFNRPGVVEAPRERRYPEGLALGAILWMPVCSFHFLSWMGCWLVFFAYPYIRNRGQPFSSFCPTIRPDASEMPQTLAYQGLGQVGSAERIPTPLAQGGSRANPRAMPRQSVTDLRKAIEAAPEMTAEHREQILALVDSLAKEVETGESAGSETLREAITVAEGVVRQLAAEDGSEYDLGERLSELEEKDEMVALEHPMIANVLTAIARLI